MRRFGVWWTYLLTVAITVAAMTGLLVFRRSSASRTPQRPDVGGRGGGGGFGGR